MLQKRNVHDGNNFYILDELDVHKKLNLHGIEKVYFSIRRFIKLEEIFKWDSLIVRNSGTFIVMIG